MTVVVVVVVVVVVRCGGHANAYCGVWLSMLWSLW